MPDNNTSTVVTPKSGTVAEVLAFSAPLIISNLSQSMMWVVDTAIMGRVGTVEQGAVGLAGVLTWAFLCLFTGTMTASAITVAQDHGAGRRDLARHVRTGLAVALPLGVFVIALRPIIPFALGWMHATDAVRPLASTYLSIRLITAPATLATFVVVGFMRGIGDTITPMIISLFANVVNGLLAAVLVFGWIGLQPMGVSGAAWATAIAGVVEAVAYIGVFIFDRRAVAVGSRVVQLPTWRQIRLFISLGFPIGLGWLFEMVAWTAFTAYAGTRAPVELATHTILFQATGFCFMPAVAIGAGASTLVGQYLGARRPDLAWKSAGRGLLLGCVYMTTIGLALILLRRPFFRAFNPDPAVVALGASLAFVAGLYQPFDGFGIIAQGILRGAGKTATPTIVMLGCGALVFVPLVWFLGEHVGMGILGAWAAALVHVVVSGAILGFIVVRGRWRNAVLVTQTETPLPTAR